MKKFLFLLLLCPAVALAQHNGPYPGGGSGGGGGNTYNTVITNQIQGPFPAYAGGQTNRTIFDTADGISYFPITGGPVSRTNGTPAEGGTYTNFTGVSDSFGPQDPGTNLFFNITTNGVITSYGFQLSASNTVVKAVGSLVVLPGTLMGVVVTNNKAGLVLGLTGEDFQWGISMLVPTTVVSVNQTNVTSITNGINSALAIPFSTTNTGIDFTHVYVQTVGGAVTVGYTTNNPYTLDGQGFNDYVSGIVEPAWTNQSGAMIWYQTTVFGSVISSNVPDTNAFGNYWYINNEFYPTNFYVTQSASGTVPVVVWGTNVTANTVMQGPLLQIYPCYQDWSYMIWLPTNTEVFAEGANLFSYNQVGFSQIEPQGTNFVWIGGTLQALKAQGSPWISATAFGQSSPGVFAPYSRMEIDNVNAIGYFGPFQFGGTKNTNMIDCFLNNDQFWGASYEVETWNTNTRVYVNNCTIYCTSNTASGQGAGVAESIVSVLAGATWVNGGTTISMTGTNKMTVFDSVGTGAAVQGFIYVNGHQILLNGNPFVTIKRGTNIFGNCTVDGQPYLLGNPPNLQSASTNSSLVSSVQVDPNSVYSSFAVTITTTGSAQSANTTYAIFNPMPGLTNALLRHWNVSVDPVSTATTLVGFGATNDTTGSVYLNSVGIAPPTSKTIVLHVSSQ
jgi:hypothetical protein